MASNDTFTMTFTADNGQELHFRPSKRIGQPAAPRPLTSLRHVVAEQFANAKSAKARKAIVAEHGAGWVRRSLRAHANVTGDQSFMDLRATV